MQYIYYKDPKGNFGDDLNVWLWPKVFGEIISNHPDVAFLGIGSIIENENNLLIQSTAARKVVFGTGVRPSYQALKYDKTWDVKFLRGPLSSSSFDYKHKHITDAAYALRFTEQYDGLRNRKKIHEISLMPYFKSVDYFDWKSICEKLGYNYISPLSENGVEHTLAEIANSKYLITEAMHGAILADVLRVPWSRYVLTTPYTEGAMVSELKWKDWLMSVDINNLNSTYIRFHRHSFLAPLIRTLSNNVINATFLVKKVVLRDLLASLAAVNQFYLSNDSILDKVYFKMNDEIVSFKKEFG